MQSISLRNLCTIYVIQQTTSCLQFRTGHRYAHRIAPQTLAAMNRMKDKVLKLNQDATLADMVNHPNFSLGKFRVHRKFGRKTLIAIAALITDHGYGEYVDPDGVQMSLRSRLVR